MDLSLKLATAIVSLTLTFLLGALAPPLQAQTSAEPFSPGPYKIGERLTYNVSFSSFSSAAHVEMLVAARGTFFGREGIQLKGHVETLDPVYAALLALNHDYITYVDPANGLPYYGQQIVRVASRTSDVTAEFNQIAGAAEPKRTGQFPGVYDILSAVYRVRALPLTSGTNYNLIVRGENETYDVVVKVTGRTAVKTNVGSFDAIRTRIDFRNNGRADDLDIRAYFSDDPRHLPVLVTADHDNGEIRAELVGSELIATPPVTPANPATSVSPTTPPSTLPPTRSVAPTAPSTPPTTTPAPDDRLLEGLPFRVGEQLNYQVYLPTINSAVGQATFQVRARSKYFNKDGLLFTVNAQTTNALQHLFFASDTISSYVDPRTLLPFQTEMNLAEGRSRTNNKLTINQDYGNATNEKGERIEIPVGTHDYVSFFYMLRTFNLVPPRRSAVSILVNNRPKTLFITAISREAIQLGRQSIPATQISLTTDDADPDKYQLRVWVSDDQRRLPLRITAKTQLGAIRADLAIVPVATR